MFSYLFSVSTHVSVACSRRSDSGARAKNKANERAGKNEGRLAFFFARTPLSECLEQANVSGVVYHYSKLPEISFGMQMEVFSVLPKRTIFSINKIPRKVTQNS